MTERDTDFDRLNGRFSDGDTSSDTDEQSETSETEQTEKPSEPVKTGESETGSVKDRPYLTMYLPSEQFDAVALTFDELNLQHKRAHGTDLEKNRDYYPALIKAGLENRERLEDLLNL
jgi:vacuolar-type H+-ATPase subunit I/STV1